MSLRRFNPFRSKSSNASIRSTRPPTYTSNATAAPTYTANDPRATDAHDRNERVSAWSASLPSASSVASPASVTLPDDSLTDTVSVGGTSAAITTPRYIYYRLYTEDGAIPSLNPVYSDDPYMGRITADLVTPPHTAISVKRCLSRVENIYDVNTTKLFIVASSRTPMGDATRVSIHADSGPGCIPNEPMALVATSSHADRSWELMQPRAGLLPGPEGPTPFETRYLYYRVYEPSGAIPSKQPADSNKPLVGRISVHSIPPPHTAASIRRCIFKIEGSPGFRASQLFTSIFSESPIDEEYASILTDSNRPGSTPEDPVAFIFDDTRTTRTGPAGAASPPVGWHLPARAQNAIPAIDKFDEHMSGGGGGVCGWCHQRYGGGIDCQSCGRWDLLR